MTDLPKDLNWVAGLFHILDMFSHNCEEKNLANMLASKEEQVNTATL